MRVAGNVAGQAEGQLGQRGVGLVAVIGEHGGVNRVQGEDDQGEGSMVSGPGSSGCLILSSVVVGDGVDGWKWVRAASSRSGGEFGGSCGQGTKVVSRVHR
jgi:hypothetical protein